MEKATYEEMRAIEDHHWWYQGRRLVVAPLIEEAFGRSGGGRLLDVGCGTGGNLAFMGELLEGSSLVGVDFDHTALALNATRHLPVELLCADGTRLPVKDASLGCVTALDIIEHFADDARLLAELHRVLRPGGQLVATVPAYPALWSPHDEVLHHFRRYRTGELEARLRQAGFEIERKHGFNFLLLPLIASVRFVRNGLKWLEGGREHIVMGADAAKETDFFMLPRPVNAIVVSLFRFERWLVRRLPVPFGVSFMVRARKP